MALTRTKAGGFGADIPAGTPCNHLQGDNRCQIHPRLREEGWPACTVFDCFGAGQQITQVTFGGVADWREGPETAGAMFTAFASMRHLMEMLRLLTEARELADGPLAQDVDVLVVELQQLVAAPADQVASADIAGLRSRVGPVLVAISESHRLPTPRSRRFQPRAQLMGSNLRKARLDRHCLRSALLIAADLRGATFERTDLLGADLRDADLSGADLRGAIFLTQQQVDAARGSESTRLPAGLHMPSHWNRAR
ncbi:pentapeptide repeat-containing protein [Luteococcus sp. Sow4_B9]|uniref:pentapeptide repeat-containing protein n=1 Tax=Luteococcus sp. Sow4_B9 TaxID=3438792 RepID=UPI003F9C55AB